MPIRRTTATELPLLLAIDAFARRHPSYRAWLRRAIAERGSWVLVQARGIVAHGVLRRSFFDHWFVEALYVTAKCRRTGCGSQLLAFFEAKASASGEIWTSTNRSNRRMRLLLKKRGFVQRGRVTGLDQGDAEIFFAKRKS